MQASINRFLYGPTPEEKVRAWRSKLRTKQRELERDSRQVGLRQNSIHARAHHT
jgi:charged multivesicular body protein 3